MKLRLFPVLLILVSLIQTAPAGWYFESKTDAASRGESEGGAFTHEAKTWLDGDKMRMEFTRSDNPMMPQGSYMLSRDGGATLLLVHPQQKTYSTFNPGEFAGAAMNMMGSMMQFKNPVIEKMADEDAGKMLGQSVRRYVFRTSYDMEMNIFGMRQTSRYESTQEIWAASRIDAGKFDVFGFADAMPVNDAAFKEQIKATMAGVKGLPLKQVMTTRTTELDGSISEDTATTTVTTLREEKIPAEMFAIPEGFEEVPLLAAIAGAAREDGEDIPEDMPAFDPAKLMEMMKQFQPPGN